MKRGGRHKMPRSTPPHSLRCPSRTAPCQQASLLWNGPVNSPSGHGGGGGLADDQDATRRGCSNGAARTRKRGEACGGRPGRGGAWASKTIKRPAQLSAQANPWALRTRRRRRQEHRPQRPSEHSDPTQHAKGRAGDCPGPRKENCNPTECHNGGGGSCGLLGVYPLPRILHNALC